MELNKHILLVMKWLDDPKSVSKDELIENRKSAAGASYASYASYVSDNAEYWVNKYFERTGENKQDYIDAMEAGNKAEESNHYNQPNWDEAPSKDAVWIESADNGCGWHIYQNGYFYQCDDKSHGWSLCDDEKGVITVHKRPIETSQEWDGEGLPPIGCECLFKYDQGGDPLKLLIMGYFADLVWATEDHRTTPYSGSHRTIIKTQGKFSPLKTEKEKEREAFIEWGKKGLSYRLEEQSFAIQILEQLADNGAKAPEGE